MNGGEEELSRAVIRQAWLDAFPPAWAQKIRQAAQLEAWRWLTMPTGEWADARADWCAMAGVCPHTLRLRALARRVDYDAGQVAQNMAQERAMAERAQQRAKPAGDGR
jgi:hypothetical protein